MLRRKKIRNNCLFKVKELNLIKKKQQKTNYIIIYTAYFKKRKKIKKKYKSINQHIKLKNNVKIII